MELHPHGISPIFWRNVLDLFVLIKLNFSCNFPFFIWFIPLVDILGIKPALGDHESNFKKEGAIPFGCNNKWTTQIYFRILYVYEIRRKYILLKFRILSYLEIKIHKNINMSFKQTNIYLFLSQENLIELTSRIES